MAEPEPEITSSYKKSVFQLYKEKNATKNITLALLVCISAQ